MLEIGIMIEGQNGLTWRRWQNIVRAVEDLGFVGLYQSDHFTNASAPDKESLELWVSLTWLAGNTQRIEFGPLVSPMSFRHPAFTARMAAGVDDLSNGRLTLGLGAGWQEREHELFGFDLLEVKPRFARFEEGLQVITSLLRSEQPGEYIGDYYQLRGASLLPPPQRRGGPPILIGGNSEQMTLPLVVRFADEWNAIFLTPEQFRLKNACLDELLRLAGRDPASVRRSMMTGLRFAGSKQELEAKLSGSGRSANELRQRGVVIGVGDEIKEQLAGLEQAGLQRVMLQWLDLDDISGLEALSKIVV